MTSYECHPELSQFHLFLSAAASLHGDQADICSNTRHRAKLDNNKVIIKILTWPSGPSWLPAYFGCWCRRRCCCPGGIVVHIPWIDDRTFKTVVWWSILMATFVGLCLILEDVIRIGLLEIYSTIETDRDQIKIPGKSWVGAGCNSNGQHCSAGTH